MKKQLSILFFTLIFLPSGLAQAKDMIGFPRSDFGKIVLSKKQSFSGKLESSIGNYNNEPISIYNKRSIFRKLGRPVGRLDILTNIRSFPCTAFLVSDKYLVTNYHCVPGIIEMEEVKEKGATRIDAVQLVLGYTREGIEEDATRFSVSPVPVEANKTLDYAILEVFGRPSDKFGIVKLASTVPYSNQPFFIIGHPLGMSQRISREKCLSADPAISGGEVRHKCDTLPGNSGSPVFDQDNRTVIALHHAGSSQNSINYAIPFSRIIKQSPLLRRIMKGQRVASMDHGKPLGQSSSKPGFFGRIFGGGKKKEEPKVAVGIYPDLIEPVQPIIQRCTNIEMMVRGKKRCLKPGDSFRDFSWSPEMVLIPAGHFTMGSKNGNSSEKPPHKVTISKPFALGKYEVTVGQFKKFVQDTKYKTGSQCWIWTGKWKNKGGHSWRNPGFSQNDNHPVACVSWKDAQAYIRWLNKKMSGNKNAPYQLPTEAQWEYAARAGTKTKYSFGNTISTGQANFNNKLKRTTVTGEYPANKFGLHDMHGNVWEWVSDKYDENYYKNSPSRNPENTKSGSFRVVRGGSWYNIAGGLRSALRINSSPGSHGHGLGFRLMRQPS